MPSSLMPRCVLPAAGMDQLSKNLACEWASSGIRCNSVKPWCVLISLVSVAHSLAAANICAALQVHCEFPPTGHVRPYMATIRYLAGHALAHLHCAFTAMLEGDRLHVIKLWHAALLSRQLAGYTAGAARAGQQGAAGRGALQDSHAQSGAARGGLRCADHC